MEDLSIHQKSGLPAFQQAAKLPKLKRLSFNSPQVTPEIIELLRSISTLKAIDLSANNSVTAQQAALFRSLKQVTELLFRVLKFDDDALRALSRANQIVALNLEVRFTDNELMILSENQGLRSLSLQRTQVTAAGLAKFRAARPDVK